jgi:hypothetical protein
MEKVDWTSQDWSQFNPHIKGEVIPYDQPESHGQQAQVNIFCDAAHATCHVMRRSKTGIIFFVNGAPIIWYSKRQNTIETSTFGIKFVALDE